MGNKDKISLLAGKMTEYEAGCPERIHHFLKVYAFARHIGILTGLSKEEQNILEAAALVHDIGIRPSLEKYGSTAGPYQEQEGPGVARPMLEELGFSEEVIERVCYLVAHHHTYQEIRGLDYQILVEADFLVNLHEGKSGLDEILLVQDKIFRTEAGTQMLRQLFLGGAQ